MKSLIVILVLLSFTGCASMSMRDCYVPREGVVKTPDNNDMTECNELASSSVRLHEYCMQRKGWQVGRCDAK